MLILQNNRFVITKKSVCFLYDLVLLLFIFSSPILNSFLFIFGGSNESGQLAIIYIISFILMLLLFLITFRCSIKRKQFLFIFLFIIILSSFIFTGFRENNINAVYFSEFKLYCAMFPTTLLISIVGQRLNKENLNITCVFFCFLVISISTFLALVRSNGVTGGGFVNDSSGFMYQNISYYSAYGFGLGIFLLNEIKEKRSKHKYINILIFSIIILNILSCLLSGGRGGFVLLFIMIFFYSFINKGVKGFVKAVFTISFIVIIALIIIPLLSDNIGVDLSGFQRLLNFMDNGISDPGRELLYKISFNSFQAKPILGNGIGSVFYILNTYSHNLFIDILCETGFVGLLIFMFFLLLTMRKMFFLYKKGSLYRFLTLIFICGITLNLFSGYIWVNQFVWVPIVLINSLSISS